MPHTTLPFEDADVLVLRPLLVQNLLHFQRHDLPQALLREVATCVLVHDGWLVWSSLAAFDLSRKLLEGAGG